MGSAPPTAPPRPRENSRRAHRSARRWPRRRTRRRSRAPPSRRRPPDGGRAGWPPRRPPDRPVARPGSHLGSASATGRPVVATIAVPDTCASGTRSPAPAPTTERVDDHVSDVAGVCPLPPSRSRPSRTRPPPTRWRRPWPGSRSPPRFAPTQRQGQGLGIVVDEGRQPRPLRQPPAQREAATPRCSAATPSPPAVIGPPSRPDRSQVVAWHASLMAASDDPRQQVGHQFEQLVGVGGDGRPSTLGDDPSVVGDHRSRAWSPDVQSEHRGPWGTDGTGTGVAPNRRRPSNGQARWQESGPHDHDGPTPPGRAPARSRRCSTRSARTSPSPSRGKDDVIRLTVTCPGRRGHLR